jgi:DNA-binding XRE family transcriptional regulator
LVERGWKKLKIGRARLTLKQARKDSKMTQQQMSFEIFESREAVSQQENGGYRVQPNIANYFTREQNNPWVALEAAAEYTSWGPVKLDGEYVDLHRASVAAKTLEELEEALTAIKNVCVANNPKAMKEYEKSTLEEVLIQAIDANVALTHYIAVICKEYEISWMKIWNNHRTKLQARGYLKA